MNELVVRPEIADYADLRGKTMVVDATNTAYALLLYKMLSLKGLQKQDCTELCFRPGSYHWNQNLARNPGIGVPLDVVDR